MSRDTPKHMFMTSVTSLHPSAELAAFASHLQFNALPAAVVARTEDLILDWIGSALAGRQARPVRTIEAFAQAMGPNQGPSEVLISRRHTSPLFAAMVNAAASHVVEQDDVHNSSVFHPAAVVIGPALATAQAIGASGAEFLTAVVAGYEVGIRVGEFLGRSHYVTFHTTATAGTLAAAAAVGRLLELDAAQMLHAFGSAGTQSAGVWEFLRDAADSKQLHCAHAAAAGVMSAYLARDGFTGAQRVLEGAAGLGVGMSHDADAARLNDRLGSRWTLAETSFKYHASCRHTHPAADALLAVMRDHQLQASDLAHVIARVHQGAIDVLGRVVVPTSVHQAKFSMGTVLGLIAVHGVAGLKEFDREYLASEVAQVRDQVTMELDPEVDAAYPARWIGKVIVTTTDGRVLHGRVDEPKGDPGNTLTRAELEAKARALAAYGEGATTDEMCALTQQIWNLTSMLRLGDLLPQK